MTFSLVWACHHAKGTPGKLWFTTRFMVATINNYCQNPAASNRWVHGCEAAGGGLSNDWLSECQIKAIRVNKLPHTGCKLTEGVDTFMVITLNRQNVGGVPPLGHHRSELCFQQIRNKKKKQTASIRNSEHNSCRAKRIHASHISPNVSKWLHMHTQTCPYPRSQKPIYQWVLVLLLQLCRWKLRLCWDPAEIESSWRLPVGNLAAAAPCLSSPDSACSLFLPAFLSAVHCLEK